ncbi:tyrosine-type recombinase/integrase [Sulfurospirillum sp. MES]|uniref:tyrosine-type recombinase/integrase n=1 Tax=Sulfurospirillum sp. MES TaxID=1565314 RepID=UPI000541B3AF|nr:tyrosine-type recombinase/integrase [Sulfurospirillum sp. MES]KHG33768.1 MAG: hypothetical protein OA34_08000 [Sulfurospirillum sp. MES]
MGNKNMVADREGGEATSLSKPLKIATLTNSKKNCYVNFSKNNIKNYDSLRLYRVKNNYYYRRTINKKTYRVSLHTKDIIQAKVLKKELNLLEDMEFIQMAEENKHKKIIEAKIGSNLEFAGEELEKIFEIATHTLKRNPSMLKAIAEEKQLIEQTTYKIAKKNELEEILQKLDTINSNQSTNTQPNKDSEIIEKSLLISQDFDKYYNDFVEYKIKSDKISKSSGKSYASAKNYLKYFMTQETIFNFSFFKDIQKKLQELPANFFKYKKYYDKSFNEVLELKKTEDYNTLSSKTVNNHMSTYRLFFDYLIYEEIFQDNPLKNIKSLKEDEEDNSYIEYSQEELTNIFNSKMPKPYLNMCKFALYTGMRIGEVLSIKKNDIEGNFIYITLKDTSKKKHSRMVPIHINLVNTIEEQKKKNHGEYLFFTGNTVREVDNIGRQVRRHLTKIVNEEYKTFHSFRKNFSQEIEVHTMSEEKTKKYLMGHSFKKDVTQTTYNRGKINEEKLIDCINQITFTY